MEEDRIVTTLIARDELAISEFREKNDLCQNCDRNKTEGAESDCCWICRFIGEVRGQEARVRLLQLEASKET